MTARIVCAVLALLLVVGCTSRLDSRPLPPAPPPTPATYSPVAFPKDEAPHDSLTEWWYYTGHLEADDGRRWGFELVTFQILRSTLAPVYVSHFAITDRQRQQFHHDARGSQGAQTQPAQGFAFDVAGWTMSGLNGLDRLAADLDGYGIQLDLHTDRLPVLNGGGLVSFGPAGESYYYSRTRMDVRGTLIDQGEEIPVHGQAWFDKQWGNFLVMGGGWDWFSMQVEDGTDVMLNLIRDAAGEIRMAYGTYVDPNGEYRHLDAGQFEVTPLGTWTSPHTGVTYPSGWQASILGGRLNLTVKPVLEDQELNTRQSTGLVYWEGAQDVAGTLDGRAMSGRGYVELVGYDQQGRQSGVGGR